MEKKLPSPFIQNIHAAFGGRGRDWLDRLPDLIEEASAWWDLELDPVYPIETAKMFSELK